MKVLHTLFIILVLGTSVNAQEISDEYIRIIGNAKETFDANEMQLTLNLQEQERNEYQKTQEKSLEQIEEELSAALKSMGLRFQDMKEVFPPARHYGKQEQTNYVIKVKSKEKAKELYKLKIPGLKVTDLKYLYDTSTSIDLMSMATQSIKDAKRKADALAQKMGKKVGRVLNVEDSSPSQMILPKSHSQNTYSLSYKITITYELLD